MSKPLLYVDMDGVLADFSTAFYKSMGIQTGRKIISITYEWKQLQDKWPTFWEDLDYMPNGQSLWRVVSKYEPSLLTACPPSWPSAAKGKLIWVKRKLPKFGYSPRQKFIACMRQEKQKYAKQANGTPNILIDDADQNIAEWNAAGGLGVHYIDSASAVRRVADILEKHLL